MEIKNQYVLAMRERAPKMSNRLRRRGEMEQHLQEKAEEAAAMYEAMTAKAPRWDNGLVEQPHRREAEDKCSRH